MARDDINDFPQVHYTEQRLTPNPQYSGAASIWPPSEAEAVLLELLAYFGITSGRGLPNPPSGLPGKCNTRSRWEEKEILCLGLEYLSAVLRGEGRAQHNIWERAAETCRAAYWKGYERRKKEEDDWREAEIQRQIEIASGAYRANTELVADQIVYFIASEAGPIKIGITNNVTARLKGLQTAHHERLEVLATCEGGQPKEREYHARFAEHRLHGEWFARHPEILAEIESLAA